MYRLAVWVCCLALAGCQFSIGVSSKPTATVKVIKHPGFTELQKDKIVSKVQVIDGTPKVTLTLTEDSSEPVIYVAKTEHDCKTRTSTLKYLAVFDKDEKLLEERELELDLEVTPDSIGEAELTLACPNKGTYDALV